MKSKDSDTFLPLPCKVGGVTLYRRNGVVVARKSRNTKQSKVLPTLEQCRHRLRFSNCVNLWHVFDGDFKPSFALSRQGRTDYNSFVQVNLSRCDRYMTREMIEQGGCVPFQMMLTQGVLPTIRLTPADGLLVSSLQAGDLAIGDASVLGDIWSIVAGCNHGIYHSDQITFVFISYNNADPEVPRMDCFSAKFDLDRFDRSATVCLNNVTLPVSRFFAVTEQDGKRLLAFRPLDGTGAYYDGLAVFLRNKEDKLSTSIVSYIHPSDAYTSRQALLQAAASYGGVREMDNITPALDHQDLESDFNNQ